MTELNKKIENGVIDQEQFFRESHLKAQFDKEKHGVSHLKAQIFKEKHGYDP